MQRQLKKLPENWAMVNKAEKFWKLRGIIIKTNHGGLGLQIYSPSSRSLLLGTKKKYKQKKVMRVISTDFLRDTQKMGAFEGILVQIPQNIYGKINTFALTMEYLPVKMYLKSTLFPGTFLTRKFPIFLIIQFQVSATQPIINNKHVIIYQNSQQGV